MLLAAAFLLLVLASESPTASQAPASIGPPMDLSTLQNYVPLGPPANLKPSAVPDLSGAWLRSGGLQSVSAVDTGGKMRGKEPDIPYRPWALQKMMSEVPPTGPFAEPHRTTDPWIRYCESNGPFRIFMHPGRVAFQPLPDRVLILHERIALRRANVPFMQSPWNCSVRDNEAFTKTLLNDAVPK